MMPFMLTVFFTAILIVRLYDRFTPAADRPLRLHVGGRRGFLAGLVVRNDWSTFPVLLGLVTVGLGQGALVTLLFNVLVTSSPKELSADVGALRGTQNLAASVGTAVMGTLVVGVLSASVMTALTANPVITADLKAQVDLDNINFLSNDRLKERLKSTTATPEQVTRRCASTRRPGCARSRSLSLRWDLCRSWRFSRPACCRTTGPAKCRRINNSR